MVSADNWPTFAEELGRKAITEVEKWTNAFDIGRISLRECFIAVSTIYDTTSGLAPKEISDLIANVHEELRRHGKK